MKRKRTVVRRTRKRSAASYSSPPCYLHEMETPPSRVATPDVEIKRVYSASSPLDGVRVLIDRLWPRGVRRDEAAVDEWLKDLAPSTALRKWFGHDPGRWKEFRRRYLAELKTRREALQTLRERARRGRVTLIYSARDREFNHAVILKALLRSRRASSSI